MPVFDKKDKSRYTTFTRRTVAVGGGMTAVLGVLVGRLYQLQIRDGDQYLLEAEDNRVNQRLLAPPRGRIIDRFGVELANNRRNYRVLLVAEQATGGIRAALDTVSKLIVLTDQQKKRVLHDIEQNKKFVPVPIAENLSWEEFARINLHLPYLPGVQPDIGETRAYPFDGELSHVLGYVAAVSPDDKKNDDDPLLDLPGFRIGKRGVEKKFDHAVRGRAGVSRAEVDAHGRVIRELGRVPGVTGEDVYLTIDREVQQFAQNRLGEESATAVVMDVETGDVIALASTPTFDPNLFNVGITTDEWNRLIGDDHKPLLNKAVDATYPPGSTFKPAVALAAVDAGIITPDYRVFCSGTFTLGNHTFHCWGRHGSLDLKGGIKNSCDIFFWETARRVGIDKISEAARKLGLGTPTGIELPGEHGGLVPSRAWKEATYHVPWQQGDTLNVGIGQGYVVATPLQLCQEAARLASGKMIRPRLVHMVGGQLQPRPAAEPVDFSDDAFAQVRDGMNAVMNEPGGTAYPWRITEAGFEMAGKTGTAQVRVISAEEHKRGVTSNQNLEWKLRDHALFIGFAPVDAPKYAIVSVIEHGATTAHVHVQMARDILLYTQKRDPARRPTAYPVKAAALQQTGGGG